MNRKRWLILIVVIVVVFLLLILCVGIGSSIGLSFIARSVLDRAIPPSIGQYFGGPPIVIRPDISTGTDLKDWIPPGIDNLALLEKTEVPISDLYDLAERLQGKTDIPISFNPPPAPYSLGTKSSFWISNADTNQYFQVEATLRSITDHVYFWIETDLEYQPEDLENLALKFENKIYPTNRAYFGSEWTPGVDGDPRLYIVYVHGLGKHIAGVFASRDEYNPIVSAYSNAHELFLINSDTVDLGEDYIFGTLAHEFQHMIQWYQDQNETTWISEGLSELAIYLNGEGVSSDRSFIRNTDIQLTNWPDESLATFPHYGASFLFLTYFLDRFGEGAIKKLVAESADDLQGVDAVLKEIGAEDSMTGETVTADDLFSDWVVTNYLQDKYVGDGRFTYQNYPEAPKAEATETISRCKGKSIVRDVSQYGTDYIRITCPGDYLLHFEGSTEARVLPMDPFSGNHAFWSNRGDESDMMLTREFDFLAYSGQLNLTFQTWYDLEADYDYAYLEISEDGQAWDILTTPSGTAEDLSGNSYGWGYNGQSEGWVKESVDLSDYAGKKVYLRFEYVTDAAVNGEGMLIDDITIPEIGYFEDFEHGSGDWEVEGWVRLENVLPQTYNLVMITKGDTNEVKSIQLGPDISADIPIQIGEGVDEVILVVSGTTRFTQQKAAYQIEFR